MKVKFLVSVGGLDYTYQPNETYEVEEKEAIRFIDGGLAEAKNKKDYDSAIEKIEALKEEQKQAQKLSELNATLETLKEEKEQLENRIKEIDNSILEVEEIIKGK